MTKQPSRERRAGLITYLQSRQQGAEFKAMVEMLESLIEESKVTLMTCTPDDFRAIQGEAQAYQRLFNMLTRPPRQHVMEQ